MRTWTLFLIGIVLITELLLTSCARSPDATFYVLNPIPYHMNHSKKYQDLRIGINDVSIPAYMSKPEIIIHDSAHHVELKNFHQWAGALNSNIQRVIATNLATLLPGAAVATVPWDIKFKPNYQLQIDISQFEVDLSGDSVLRADYLIYAEDKLYKKGTLYYHLKIPQVTVESLVSSMNDNLTHFTKDLARILAR